MEAAHAVAALVAEKALAQLPRVASTPRARAILHGGQAARREMVSAQEIPREKLIPGAGIDGPAVIVEEETTTIVTSSYRAIGQGDGSIRLTRKEVAI